MSDKGRKALRWGIAVAVGLLITGIAIFFEHDAFEDSYSVVRYLADGFFVSSVLFLGLGVLAFIAIAGNFYGLSYIFAVALPQVFLPKSRFAEKKDYYTYCQEKKAKQDEKPKYYRMYLIIGGSELAISLIFTALNYVL